MKRRLLVGGLVAALVVILGMLGAPLAFKLVYAIQQDQLPPIISRTAFDEQIWQATRILDRHGELLAESYRERRTIVPIEELPDHLIQAVVAAEDKRFFDHGGVDWPAIYRAVAVDVARMKLVQGASTLTQQLARNLYLSQERTLLRKFNEMLVATRLEEVLDKDEILHQYLNLIYLGHGRYGVEEAARFYFGKSATAVDLWEAVLLAGIIKGPEVFSPRRSAEKAQRRMAYVARQMVAAGYIDEATAAKLQLPALAPVPAAPSGLSPYGVDAVLATLIGRIGREAFDLGGYRLETTIDPELQNEVNQAVADQLPGLGVGLVTASEEPESLCNCITDARIPTGCPVWARVKQRTAKGDGTVVDLLGRLGRVPDDALERMSATDPGAAALQPGAFVRVIPNQEVPLDSPWLTEESLVVPVVAPQVAAVLMEVDTGAVRAVYGGIDHRYHPYNRAITARRPIGSTVKPFVYLAAMQTLAWDTDTSVDARCLDLRQADGKRWPIRDSHDHGDELTIEEALAISSNCAAVRTFRKMGAELVVRLWHQWGLPQLDTDDASLALGSAALSPMELASAYALLGHGQCTPQPLLIDSAQARNGRVLALPAQGCAGNPPAEEIQSMARSLEKVVTEGTGKRARVEGIAMFGKTGTSNGGRDAWFAGVFTPPKGPALVLVVWVGSDDFSPLEGNSGPTTAATVWRAIVSEIVAD